MIRPPHIRGAAFTTSLEGDMRHGPAGAVSQSLGIPTEWATARQVHGDAVLSVDVPGPAGSGDALMTSDRLLPLAVFTADCVGVVVEADAGIAVAHAGWRGVTAKVVEATLLAMRTNGLTPLRAAIGPHIRSCCFEVGPEVAAQFAEAHQRETTWGTPSVDLGAAVAEQLLGLAVWDGETCTRCTPGFFSHRANGTRDRMAALAWLN